MDRPLGYAVGNALEVREAIDTLKGNGPEDLKELSLAIVTRMLYKAGKGSDDNCRHLAEEALASGAALDKLGDLIEAQGGDRTVINDPDRLPCAPHSLTVNAPKSGFIVKSDAEAIGNVCTLLGAGRATKTDVIDMGGKAVVPQKFQSGQDDTKFAVWWIILPVAPVVAAAVAVILKKRKK